MNTPTWLSITAGWNCIIMFQSLMHTSISINNAFVLYYLFVDLHIWKNCCCYEYNIWREKVTVIEWSEVLYNYSKNGNLFFTDEFESDLDPWDQPKAVARETKQTRSNNRFPSALPLGHTYIKTLIKQNKSWII